MGLPTSTINPSCMEEGEREEDGYYEHTENVFIQGSLQQLNKLKNQALQQESLSPGDVEGTDSNIEDTDKENLY